MPEKSDLCEFKMSLFDNGNTEELFVLICNFNMNLEASVNLNACAKIQNLCGLVRGEALRQLDVFPAVVESASPEALTSIILVWVHTFSCWFDVQAKERNAPQNEEAAQFKKICYAAHFVDLD